MKEVDTLEQQRLEERRVAREAHTEKSIEVNSALDEYYKRVEENTLVGGIIYGYKEGLKTQYVVHVASDNFTFTDLHSDDRFAALNEDASKLFATTGKFLPLRISLVTPVSADSIREKLNSEGYQIKEFHKETNGVYEEASWKDELLLGGLSKADNALDNVEKDAIKIKEEFDEDMGSWQEQKGIFGFSVFDKIADKKAAELLENIALVRNATIQSGYVRGLELIAEPIRVLEELCGRSTRDYSKITEFDVRVAIESGALDPLKTDLK